MTPLKEPTCSELPFTHWHCDVVFIEVLFTLCHVSCGLRIRCQVYYLCGCANLILAALEVERQPSRLIFLVTHIASPSVISKVSSHCAQVRGSIVLISTILWKNCVLVLLRMNRSVQSNTSGTISTVGSGHTRSLPSCSLECFERSHKPTT